MRPFLFSDNQITSCRSVGDPRGPGACYEPDTTPAFLLEVKHGKDQETNG